MNLKMKKYATGFFISLVSSIIVPIWWILTNCNIGKKADRGSFTGFFAIVALISIVVYSIWYFASYKKKLNSGTPSCILPIVIVTIAALVFSVVLPFAFYPKTSGPAMVYEIVDFILVMAGIIAATKLTVPK